MLAYIDIMSLTHLDGIRAVAFDAVGTLLEPDPKPALVYSEVGKRHGTGLSLAAIASGFREAFDAQEHCDVLSRLATDETRERTRWREIVGSVLHDVSDCEACFKELWQHFASSSNWKLAPGTGELLTTLRERKLKLAVASNFDARLHSVLAGFPECRWLHDVVISSEVGWRKPAPEFFAALCRRMECNPSEILFVGDNRTNDYDGAREAGLQALLLDPTGKYVKTDCRRILILGEMLEPGNKRF